VVPLAVEQRRTERTPEMGIALALVDAMRSEETSTALRVLEVYAFFGTR
jgi:hypothetical protein